MNPRGLLLLVLIGVVAGFTWWVANLDTAEERTARISAKPGPDYYMRNYRLSATDEHGQLMYLHTGESLVHQQSDDTGDLIAPHFVFYREGRAPVTVRSQTGWVAPAGEEVHLLGEVKLQRPEDAQRPRLDVTTRDLRVDPQAQTAETDERVEAVSTAYRIEGVGMHADLQRGLLHLRAGARGDYRP